MYISHFGDCKALCGVMATFMFILVSAMVRRKEGRKVGLGSCFLVRRARSRWVEMDG